MAWSFPVPFVEALDYARSRGILPTNLGTAELRQLEVDVRRRSVFSARTTHARYLQDIKTGIDTLLNGEANEATVRAWLQDILDSLDYTPERGFGDDPTIPPAERGSLRDLSSDRRIKLILDTQESQVANYGYVRQGQDELARWAFPCWELVRVRSVGKERGDWERRWVRAGGTIYQGRMIAPKGHAVWQHLGSSGLFSDGLDNPYPPFAFGSGMGIREVARAECIALGVIEASEVPQFKTPELNAELKVNAAEFDDDFLAALQDDLDAEIRDDELRLKEAGQ